MASAEVGMFLLVKTVGQLHNQRLLTPSGKEWKATVRCRLFSRPAASVVCSTSVPSISLYPSSDGCLPVAVVIGW